MTKTNGWTVTRVRCPDGARLWDAIKGKGMTQDEWDANGGNIIAYRKHLLTCPNCGPLVIVRREP